MNAYNDVCVHFLEWPYNEYIYVHMHVYIEWSSTYNTNIYLFCVDK